MNDLPNGQGSPAVIDSNYYSEGERWEAAIYRHAVRSRNVWRGISLVLGCWLLVAHATMYSLFPLKTLEVVTLIADKTTGYVEVAQPLEPNGPLSQNEAITRASIVRFIKARETYDPKGLRDNYDMAQLYSTGSASRDLEAEFSSSNPDNPMRKYGADTVTSVLVKSVIFLNERTAAVRFQTNRKSDRENVIEHWVANVRFRTTATPMRNDWRFDNPLGFQVTEYRKDQETISPTVERSQ